MLRTLLFQRIEEAEQELDAAGGAPGESRRDRSPSALRTAVDELMALTYKMTEDLYAELGGEEAQ